MRRHRAGLVSTSLLSLVLGAAAAMAQMQPTPDIPQRDTAHQDAGQTVAPGDDEQAMTTSAIAPSAAPQSGPVGVEVEPQPAATASLDTPLDIPAVTLPPLDPALTAIMVPAAPALPHEPLPPATTAQAPAFPLPEAIVRHMGDALALPRLGERERAEIAAAYQANGNRPLWIDGKGWSAAGGRIVATLEHAGEDGLRPTDYALPVFEASDIAGLAQADVRLSALAVLYARDARGARIDPRKLSKLLTPTLFLPSATEVLSELAAAPDAGAVLSAYNPPHEAYRRLKSKLAEMRRHQDDTPLVRIPGGPALKLGMRDERVALVRARLGLGPSEEPVFDRSTALALADFQKKAGLQANGILSAQTLSALGTPATARAEQDIVAQMERWRWLPADLGESHIVVNVPEFLVRVMRDGKLVHQTRAIVGKPETATPIFSHRMDHVVVNPSWNVPPSILKNEFLPGLAADPDYAAKRGYVVTRRGNSISVRQPPGERNALGWIKFMFPNDHSVYLHDTPNRRLFANERRAFSHGCVRVDNPFLLADQVLGPEWTTERLRRMIGSGERTIRLPQPLPIHIVYNTHVVDAAGHLTVFEDIYGVQRLVRQALDQRS